MANNGHLTPDELKHYQDEGYIILEPFFGAGETDALRAHVDVFDAELNKQLLASGEHASQVPSQIAYTCNLNFRDPFIQSFLAQERMANLMTQLLGPNVRLQWDQSTYKRPESPHNLPWHQDIGTLPTEPVHFVTCYLALEAMTIANGCVWVLPRTHTQGVLEHKKADVGWQCYFGDEPGISVELRKGGMVVFQSTLIHRSGPNASTDIRKSYIIQYAVDGARNPMTGVVFDNGPLIARDGKPAYSGFYQKSA